jgi:ADP-heptose:LPS heptosyltransferase
MALFEAIGEPTGDVPLLKKPVEPPVSLPQFEPTEEERRSVRIKLEEGGLPADGSGRVVILNANASDLMPLRRWDTDRFRQLAHRIVDYDDKIYIALTGAPSEQPAIEQLAQRIGHPRVIMMAGKTTLREVVTLYGLSEVLITNDSGPAHFAALTPVKIISLFGPETPNLYRPVSPNNESITANLACSPCIHVFNARDTACTDNQCMQMITVDDVFEAFRRAYER